MGIIDVILLTLNGLIIILYSILAIYLGVPIFKWMRYKGFDLFISLLPVTGIVFILSLVIGFALGGLRELSFFLWTTLVSGIVLLLLAFCMVASKTFLQEQYEQLIKKQPLFGSKSKEVSQ